MNNKDTEKIYKEKKTYSIGSVFIVILLLIGSKMQWFE